MLRARTTRIKILHKRVQRALVRGGIFGEPYYALNPYRGCIHGCLYCYARSLTREVDPRKWGKVVIVKVNIADVLRREIRSIKPSKIFIGTITDPYQPIEAIYRLTRKVLGIVLRNNVRVSVQTKNSLILRDLDILLNNRNLVDVGITITTLDNRVSRKYEPMASPPEARIKALRILSSIGIKTWIFVGPIIPGETDDINMLKEIIMLAKENKSPIIFDKFISLLDNSIPVLLFKSS